MWRRSTAKKTRHNEQGMTLPEVLITLVLLGTITGALFTSLSFISKTSDPTEGQIAEAGDIKFLQTYLPADLNSATTSDVDPLAQPMTGETLPGTNVLSLTRVQGGATIVTSYRYVQQGQRWTLVRHEKGNPANSGRKTTVTVADELAGPPATWNASTAPTHAAVVRARVPSATLPVGADVEVRFKSGNVFVTGGTGLASEETLPPFGFRGPGADAAPPSRCGGTITLVLDNSGSIDATELQLMKNAATSFITGFTGTPTFMSVVRFDAKAANVYPTSPAGSYTSLLTASPQVTAMKNAVAAISRGGGTNWEDGLWRAYRQSDGTPREEPPGLVVFLTDGDPTYKRGPSGTGVSTSASEGTLLAEAQANYGRGLGGQVVGILVGNQANGTTSVNQMKQVVGPVEWNKQTPGNAASANLFRPTDFAAIGGVFSSIRAGQCGGTITVQKAIEVNGTLSDPTETWWYSSETGAKSFDPLADDSITFDYSFTAPNPTGKHWVEIIESPIPGYTLNRVECLVNGLPAPAADVQMSAPGTPGVRVNLAPADAASCTFITRPA
jgi:prepilin-type N-terminal cleavage/methylation domain-containing protein